MAVDAKMIKELREKTGMGISDCKKALQETDGNMEEAEKYLRKRSKEKAIKKSDRATGEGTIVADVRDGSAVILQAQCEQEPTVGNERFQAFVQKALEAAFASGAESAEDLLKTASGDGTLEDELKELIGVVGENVQVPKMARLVTPEGGLVGRYIHFNKKAGALCLLKLEGIAPTDETMRTAANDVCMHAVAARPMALNRDDLPQDFIEKEKEIALAQIGDKPDNIKEKIISGKMNKLYSEKCLLEQIFVKDPDGKLKVGQFVEQEAKKAGGKAEIVGFVRLELGA